MKTITLPAHFDGKKICLDEPFDLEPNTKLIVTILPMNEHDNEHDAWLLLSRKRLVDSYAEDEPEYSLDLIKEKDSDDEGR
ncbi:MAG: hypothetical protein ACOY90_08395 [Candidatus Zhuqueibacterota bacterium]